jgi:hypothetical protein
VGDKRVMDFLWHAKVREVRLGPLKPKFWFGWAAGMSHELDCCEVLLDYYRSAVRVERNDPWTAGWDAGRLWRLERWKEETRG